MNKQGYTADDIASEANMILKIIKNVLYSAVNMPYLAEVTAVNKNRVDVKVLNIQTFDGQPLQAAQVLDLVVGLPCFGGWTVTWPIAVGDVGLCIVLDRDITEYKKSGGGGVPNTFRRYDVQDAVFLPLSMYKQPDIATDFEIKSKDEKTSITITPDGNVTVTNAGDITLQNDGNVILNNKGDLTAEVKGKTAIKCETVEVGGAALEKMIKGETFMQFFNSHVHLGNLGAPTSPPQVPMSAAQLSTNVKNS